MPKVVVVVGASLAGLRAAEQLRAQGFPGRISVVGDEPWMPYNRPPLSKEALLASQPGVTEAGLAQSLAYRPRASTAGIEWVLGAGASAADLQGRTVTLTDGQVLHFDALVAATGLSPRRLPFSEPTEGRHTLRTAGDAAALRSEITTGTHAVVVGGGFIGCEVAATLKSLGAEVTVVEPLNVPMARGVGHDVGTALLAHHRSKGVTFVTGQGVSGLSGAGRVQRLLLDDGTELIADLVVEAVGSTPNVGWLASNGLDLSDGLLCDNNMRVEGRPNVVAAGDVARFPNPRYDGIPRRVEHWCIPGETAKRAAASVMAHLEGHRLNHEPFAPLPAFWSDQFGLRLQSYGALALADSTEVLEGGLNDLDEGVAVLYRRNAEPVGVLLINVAAARYAEFRSDVASALEHAVP